MCTPTFVDMRQRMERVWFESHDCQEYVQWAGIFGSIARDRAEDESDVDVLVVFKDHIRSGEPIDLHKGVFSST
jgi:predicted nucleotidyltransferase